MASFAPLPHCLTSPFAITHDVVPLGAFLMVQKDYILRMIEQMAAVVAALRRRILKGDSTGLEAEARNMATAAGIDLSLAMLLEPDAILSLLSPDGRPDPTRVWLAAELLYLEGLSAHTAGSDDEAGKLLAKARVLYSVVDNGPLPSVVPGSRARLDEINELIE